MKRSSVLTLIMAMLIACLLCACTSSSTNPDGASNKDLAGDGPVTTADGPAADGPAADMKGDGDPATDAPPDFYLKPFPCGDTQTCYPNQYCQRIIPGVCGGTPLSDGGVCPPDCAQAGCPGGANDCTCHTYGCHQLPAGCFDCSCFTPRAGCTCSMSKGGGIQVDCAMP